MEERSYHCHSFVDEAVRMFSVDEDSKSHDKRPLIKDLLQKHRDAISSVRDAIIANEAGKAIYEKGKNSQRYDDIWILRYLLSHKGSVKSASRAALNTMLFREEKKMNELGDIRHRLRNHGVPESGSTAHGEPLPGFEKYDRYCHENAAFLTQPDKDRGLLIYCDAGQIDQNESAKGLSEDDIKEYILHANEAIFQVLDDATRRTGRLTKQMNLVDMGNVSLMKMNYTYLKRGAASSKAFQDFYPQLLGTMFIANSPTWLSAVWSALRPFFPKRLVEKFDFLPPMSKMKANKSKLKHILNYVSEENLPERYGGKNKEWPLPCASTNF
eukprot:scaffold1580_cov116-Cylindrotheca_fusiformis.AAC.22